jgi:hypothetical protein
LPLAVDLEAQISRDELRQLKCPLGNGKLACAKMALRTLRTYESKAILVHGELGVGRSKKHRY